MQTASLPCSRPAPTTPRRSSWTCASTGCSSAGTSTAPTTRAWPATAASWPTTRRVSTPCPGARTAGASRLACLVRSAWRLQLLRVGGGRRMHTCTTACACCPHCMQVGQAGHRVRPCGPVARAPGHQVSGPAAAMLLAQLLQARVSGVGGWSRQPATAAAAPHCHHGQLPTCSMTDTNG
jgi:hypothetical protein